MPEITILGVGMGNPDTLTLVAHRRILAADVLFGAKRMLEPFRSLGISCVEEYRAEQLIALLRTKNYQHLVILLSGDVGFYSAAKKLSTAIQAAFPEKALETLPGISSLSYFMAKLQLPWEHIPVVSYHGRKEPLLDAVRRHPRTFCLLADGGQSVGKLLEEFKLSEVKITAGERLSYPEERIFSLTPHALCETPLAPLSVLLLENPAFVDALPTGLPDDHFVRGNVPMTKSEVRAVVLSKLSLAADETLWDVGAGTGSVSVEAAMQLRRGQVFAIEKNPEAVTLIGENAHRFGTENIEIVAGIAPAACESLPAPDVVFLGGTMGRLEEIIAVAVRKNPRVRFVATAVSLETIAALSAIPHATVVQLQISRSRPVGSHRLLQAESPVWIFDWTEAMHG